jgi:hypothetical protein
MQDGIRQNPTRFRFTGFEVFLQERWTIWAGFNLEGIEIKGLFGEFYCIIAPICE